MYSAVIGIVGGVIDLVAGVVLIQPTMMMRGSSTMVPMMGLWVGYFLVALGLVVLLTGVYLVFARMMMNRSFVGLLMLTYGVIMLVLGTAMLRNLVPMMQGSTLSGVAMLGSGILMLYSGYGMSKKA